MSSLNHLVRIQSYAEHLLRQAIEVRGGWHHWPQGSTNFRSSTQSAHQVRLYGDGGGLWLQCPGRPRAAWYFDTRYAASAIRCGLGQSTVDQATAPVKARACRQRLLEEKDPLAERQQHSQNLWSLKVQHRLLW
ncbi:MAG: integrase arm-type DNA-binding domain-containing protein [Pseudomonadota bacterium]